MTSLTRIFHRNLRIYIFILLTLNIVLTACDKYSTFSYQITNNCNAPIKVVVLERDSIKVSTYTININEQAAILKNISFGTGPPDKNKEKGEALRGFSQIDVYKNDTIKSKTDYIKTSKWDYNKTAKFHADYLSTVSDTDF